MRRRLTVAVSLAVVMAVTGFAVPGNAGVKLQYDRAYKAAGKRCGDKEAPGRNVYREGSTLSNGKKVGPRKYRALTGVLGTMCQPVPTAEQVAYTATPAPTAATTPGPTSGACPAVIPQYIIQAESGGDPNAVNSSSGARGCYQLMPEHFQAGGACVGLSDPECAAKLWDGGRGSSNWSQTR